MGPDRIVEHLKAIREPRMRVLALVDALGAGAHTDWVDAIVMLVMRAQTLADADALIALQAVTQAAADPTLPYAARKGLYEAAIGRNAPSIARLFLTVSPNALPSAQLDKQLEKQLAPERPLRPAGRPLTLGERKSLARTHDREEILLLLRDPHPDVIAILLDNPHVTESDILRLASMRPAVPAALARIGQHRRWCVRHAVKRALVQNPAMPLADAIRIATTLRAAELTELAADASLPVPLREHAAQLGAASRKRPPA